MVFLLKGEASVGDDGVAATLDCEVEWLRGDENVVVVVVIDIVQDKAALGLFVSRV
jgi:hypothetical protein